MSFKGQCAPDFLKVWKSGCVCVCACVHAYVHARVSRLLIASGIMWCDMDPVWLVQRVLQLLYSSCSWVSSVGMTLELKHDRNQPSVTKIALYELLYLHFESPLKQLYISNRTEHFSYNDGCDIIVMCDEAFKRTASLGYRLMVSVSVMYLK